MQWDRRPPCNRLNNRPAVVCGCCLLQQCVLGTALVIGQHGLPQHAIPSVTAVQPVCIGARTSCLTGLDTHDSRSACCWTTARQQHTPYATDITHLTSCCSQPDHACMHRHAKSVLPSWGAAVQHTPTTRPGQPPQGAATPAVLQITLLAIPRGQADQARVCKRAQTT